MHNLIATDFCHIVWCKNRARSKKHFDMSVSELEIPYLDGVA